MESLRKSLELEENDPNCAEPPHLQYMEIANLLLKKAASDIDE